jgi:hypothetical protein
VQDFLNMRVQSPSFVKSNLSKVPQFGTDNKQSSTAHTSASVARAHLNQALPPHLANLYGHQPSDQYGIHSIDGLPSTSMYSTPSLQTPLASAPYDGSIDLTAVSTPWIGPEMQSSYMSMPVSQATRLYQPIPQALPVQSLTVPRLSFADSSNDLGLGLLGNSQGRAASHSPYVKPELRGDSLSPLPSTSMGAMASSFGDRRVGLAGNGFQTWDQGLDSQFQVGSLLGQDIKPQGSPHSPGNISQAHVDSALPPVSDRSQAIYADYKQSHKKAGSKDLGNRLRTKFPELVLMTNEQIGDFVTKLSQDHSGRTQKAEGPPLRVSHFPFQDEQEHLSLLGSSGLGVENLLSSFAQGEDVKFQVSTSGKSSPGTFVDERPSYKISGSGVPPQIQEWGTHFYKQITENNPASTHQIEEEITGAIRQHNNSRVIPGFRVKTPEHADYQQVALSQFQQRLAMGLNTMDDWKATHKERSMIGFRYPGLVLPDVPKFNSGQDSRFQTLPAPSLGQDVQPLVSLPSSSNENKANFSSGLTSVSAFNLSDQEKEKIYQTFKPRKQKPTDAHSAMSRLYPVLNSMTPDDFNTFIKSRGRDGKWSSNLGQRPTHRSGKSSALSIAANVRKAPPKLKLSSLPIPRSPR